MCGVFRKCPSAERSFFTIIPYSPYQRSSKPCPSRRLNFKDPEAVRALTCTLLKEDFGLTIEIPLERLIPTVPLRLNYIHWVEDLIGGQGNPRRGIDIGMPAHTRWYYPVKAACSPWGRWRTVWQCLCFTHTHAGGLLRRCVGSHTDLNPLDLSRLSPSTTVTRGTFPWIQMDLRLKWNS